MPNGNLALLDTSVYIENFRAGRFTATLLRSPWIIRCSAVVVHELRRGSRTPQELRFANELARKIWIITPTENHWIECGEILFRIRRKKGYDPNKLRELAFDVLIALSARDIGATLITCNREDFAEIRNHTLFRIVYW